MIVQGGYNDVMAGTSAAALVASIDGILAHLAARRIKAVQCGFYNRGWDAIGRTIARKYGAIFVDGSVCYDSRYRGWDGLHMFVFQPHGCTIRQYCFRDVIDIGQFRPAHSITNT